MEIKELFDYRKDILEDSKDEDGFINQRLLLCEVLPLMLDARLVDSEDYNESYCNLEADNLKANAYAVNESGERLQLFIINENTINEATSSKKLEISNRTDYENQFKRTTRFVSKAVKGQLNDEIQDSDSVKAIVSKLSSVECAEQFDVIEIFLISLTATVSFKGAVPQPRRIHFNNEILNATYNTNGCKKSKEYLISKRLIDLNFLFNVIASRGHREPLTVHFDKHFGYSIEVISAAKENRFESYLCVLKADVLVDLYKHYSNRILEKNVRSFLSFKGANKEIRATIKEEPEKFIAYNNGLTITAIDAKVFQSKKKMYIRSLTDFQIVNGGQTTASIYFSKKEGLDISQVKIMAKINIIKDTNEEKLDEFVSNISRFSNTQTKVSSVDLRARNPQLLKLKSLSESVITPSGLNWFFERAKGDFNTIVRKAGRNSNRIKKEYPKERRFSKEQLAKYYSSWGDQPFSVKKGGEKIFRYFIEQIAPEEDTKTTIDIDRIFYEELISKIILFREMEKIYGQGKNAMGQLRSAVIPYALSILYLYTDGSNKGKRFDLSKIWKNEGLEDNLSEYLKTLMLLLNKLIKKYSLSDDYGEYSKKPELWNRIKSSPEIKKFMSTSNSRDILKKYAIKCRI